MANLLWMLVSESLGDNKCPKQIYKCQLIIMFGNIQFMLASMANNNPQPQAWLGREGIGSGLKRTTPPLLGAGLGFAFIPILLRPIAIDCA